MSSDSNSWEYRSRGTPALWAARRSQGIPVIRRKPIAKVSYLLFLFGAFNILVSLYIWNSDGATLLAVRCDYYETPLHMFGELNCILLLQRVFGLRESSVLHRGLYLDNKLCSKHELFVSLYFSTYKHNDANSMSLFAVLYIGAAYLASHGHHASPQTSSKSLTQQHFIAEDHSQHTTMCLIITYVWRDCGH